jgi:hypothetical protein
MSSASRITSPSCRNTLLAAIHPTYRRVNEGLLSREDDLVAVVIAAGLIVLMVLSFLIAARASPFRCKGRFRGFLRNVFALRHPLHTTI